MNKYDNYIKQLIQNENIGAEKEQKDLYPKEQYENLLKVVLQVLKENKDASIQELRDELYKRSRIEEDLKDFIQARKMAPGAVISYGTKSYQEQLVIGNREEVLLKNGIYIPSVKPMKEDTLFDLASCTKLFTAIATLTLVEKGMLDLNADVTKYVPQFINLKGIPVFQLLTFEPLATKTRIETAKNIEEAEQILFDTVRKEVAYGANLYNDFAPMVLKYVIESVSGMKYDEYLSTEILEKIHMNSTFTKIPEARLDNTANGNYDGRYYKDGNFLVRTNATLGVSTDDKARILGQPQGILSGHAGLFSNSEDMTTLARALIDNKIINLDTRNYMAKNRCGFHFVEDGKDKYSQYLGMLCYSKNPNLSSSEVHHPLSGRSFAAAGWSGTQLTVDPINELNLSLLSNRSHNRMTFIDASKKGNVQLHKSGMKTIILPNGEEKIDATRYAWDRDDILHKCIELAFQYKMLEDITGYKKEQNNDIDKTLRKIK